MDSENNEIIHEYSKDQDVSLSPEQRDIQGPLQEIFQRSTELFSQGQKLFPETRVAVIDGVSLPPSGLNKTNLTFTFNFGFEDPRSIAINGERNYTVHPEGDVIYTDDFFRFNFGEPPDDVLTLIDKYKRHRLLTHDPDFFVRKTAEGIFVPGIEWHKKEKGEEAMASLSQIDTFVPPENYLHFLAKNLNRPATGIATQLYNLAWDEYFKELNLVGEKIVELGKGGYAGSLPQPPLEPLYYPETRKI